MKALTTRLPTALALFVTLPLGGGWARDVPASEANVTAAQRPDILILMADNWAWPHAGCLGDPVVLTPHIDRVAAGGMRFDHVFCLSPSCTAARAAFLTGRPVHALGSAANLHSRFPHDLVTFPERLASADYVVGHAGKGWGPGDWRGSGRESDPSGPRFESFDDFLAVVPAQRPFCFWFSSKLPHLQWRDGADLRKLLDVDDVHVPAYLPDQPLVRDDIIAYYGEVMAFDREVGEAIAALARAGRAMTTIVIVMGDNGWQMPHGLANVYDAGTRVPLVVSWPGRIAPGSSSSEFVNFDDFAPTFLAAAGVEAAGETTGRNLLPLWTGAAGWQSREAVLLERERHANVRNGDRGYPVRAIRTREHLYVRNLEPDRWPVGDPQTWFSVGPFGDCDPTSTKQFILDHRDDPAVRPLFAVNFAKRPAEELYVLRDDPDQIHNVADDPAFAATKRELSARLTAWMRDTADPRVEDPRSTRWDEAVFLGSPARRPQP